MIATSSVPDVFVGRRDELAFFQQQFAYVRSSGSARYVLLEGEAGIGKTRLVATIRERVAPSAVVAVGRCAREADRASLPLTEILKALQTGARGRSSALNRRVMEERPGGPGVAEAVITALHRASARAPVACIIEDLQWADAPTLAFAASLTDRCRALPILFVLTYRLDDATDERKLASLRTAAIRSGGSLLALEGLARNEMRYLLLRAAASGAGAPTPQTQTQIEELAEGNPLFARELLALAYRQGRLSLQREVPLTARALIAERSRTFSEAERTTLIRCAVVGRSFTAPFAAKVLHEPVSRIGAVLQAAVRHGLIDVNGVAFRFRQALVRRILCDELIPVLAAPLHARVAAALSECGAASDAELGEHWALAGEMPAARQHFEAAADRAFGEHNYRDAGRYYSEALRCEYPSGAARAALFERLGMAQYFDGCRAEPSTRFASCRTELDALPDALGSVRALLMIAGQYWVDARTSESVAIAAEALEALRRLDAPELTTDAALALARFEITLGDRSRAAEQLDRTNFQTKAFTAAQRANYSEIRAEVDAAYGRSAQALEHVELATEWAALGGDGELIAQTENNVALVACDLGEPAIALRHHERALAAARQTRTPWRVAYSALNFAATLTLAGRLSEARSLLEVALETGVDTPTFATKTVSVGVPLALLLGDFALAVTCMDERAVEAAWTSGEVQRIGSVAAACAAFEEARGDRTAARTIVRRALERIPYLHRCWNLPLAAIRYGEAPDIERIRLLLARSQGRSRVGRAHRLLLEACVSPANSERRRALGVLAESAFERLRWPVHRALAREVRGDAAAARLVYDAIGANPSLTSRRPRAPARDEPALSKRQGEIAALVADGSTNREIATRLCISEHTVEHHVSNVFSRLNVRSRSELAAFVVKRRLSDVAR